MASSLDRIFGGGYLKDEDISSGSETETVPEAFMGSESEEDYEPKVKKARGGVAPALEEKIPKVERNPTRRPNPKIVNRNAVMARENRMRKKQHVENLEREIARLKEERERDRKALRKAGKEVRKLTQERDHLKAVIANKSGIMAVLRAVREGTGWPMTSSLRKDSVVIKTAGSSCDEGFGASPNPAVTEEEDNDTKDLGLTTEDLFGADQQHHLLPADELLSTMMAATASEQVITTEHNYFEHSNHTSLDSGSAAAPDTAHVGVCVHIVPGGRVSVEFCDSCAVSSRLAWQFEER